MAGRLDAPLAAFVTGSLMGLAFHRADSVGGYCSFCRRLVRLGHIALAPLRMMNVIFALSPLPVPGREPRRRSASSSAASRCRSSVSSPRGTRRSATDRVSRAERHPRPRPGLLELGLTLPGFVERSKAVASLPSLCLLYLAACTPEGHDLQCFEAESDGSEPPEIYACDLVAISTFSARIFEAYAIADRLREAGVRVAMGGLHVSVLPAEAAADADQVVVGEGERDWPAVVAAAARGEKGYTFPPPSARRSSPAICRCRARICSGDRPYNRFTVQTSRGCPWRCEFCGSNLMLGQRYRRRPVAHVVRDIEAILAMRARLDRVRRRQHLRGQALSRGERLRTAVDMAGLCQLGRPLPASPS